MPCHPDRVRRNQSDANHPFSRVLDSPNHITEAFADETETTVGVEYPVTLHAHEFGASCNGDCKTVQSRLVIPTHLELYGPIAASSPLHQTRRLPVLNHVHGLGEPCTPDCQTVWE